MIGGKIESISIGGKEYPVKQETEAEELKRLREMERKHKWAHSFANGHSCNMHGYLETEGVHITACTECLKILNGKIEANNQQKIYTWQELEEILNISGWRIRYAQKKYGCPKGSIETATGVLYTYDDVQKIKHHFETFVKPKKKPKLVKKKPKLVKTEHKCQKCSKTITFGKYCNDCIHEIQ